MTGCQPPLRCLSFGLGAIIIPGGCFDDHRQGSSGLRPLVAQWIEQSVNAGRDVGSNPTQGTPCDGWMAERLKAAVSKTVVGDSPTYREFESPSTLQI